MPTFDTPAAITATVEIVVGDLRITATDRPETVVDVRPSDPGTDQDVSAAEQTRIEYADNRLLIKAPKQRGLGLFGKPGSVDVEIRVPTGSHLYADAGIGRFHSAGALGECRIRTGVGDIHLEATGPLDVKTGTGAVAVDTVAGSALVTTGSGELRLGRVDGEATIKNSNGDSRIGVVTGNLKVSAGNGDILVDRADAGVTATNSNGNVRIREVASGSVSLKTSMGELELGIPAGTLCYLDLHTQFGTVHNRLDTAAAPSSGEQAVEVRARTSYGDIIIRRP